MNIKGVAQEAIAICFSKSSYRSKAQICSIKTLLMVMALVQLFNPMSATAQGADNRQPPLNKPQPERRAKPAPFDSIFPMTEYLGPTIGVPNSDPIYPSTAALWKSIPLLKQEDIRVYGWVNPSYNNSTSLNSNSPLSYQIVPNRLKLDQVVLRLERLPNTVQTETLDWGFRFSNLYGMDYRFTTAMGYFSSQLLQHNALYGYDLPEAYTQLYVPSVAEGMVITLGRYISPPDIEAQLAPQNFLATHSLMFTFDAYTQTGATAAIKFNDSWSTQLGVHSGDDIAPWTDATQFPMLLAMLRWVSADNNDSLWGGINSLNNRQFKGNHNNFQQFNLSWSHRFTEQFFTLTEIYYIYQFNAAKGGTCNFGPIKPFGGGGGCGPIIPGRSNYLGIVNYTELKTSEKDFISWRTDFLDDYQGQATGYVNPYMSFTLGLTHQFTPLIEVRPEIRYEIAFHETAYDNGTRKNQASFIIDSVIRF